MKMLPVLLKRNRYRLNLLQNYDSPKLLIELQLQYSCWNDLHSLSNVLLRFDLKLVLTMNHTRWFETRRQIIFFVIFPKLFSQTYYGSHKSQLYNN